MFCYDLTIAACFSKNHEFRRPKAPKYDFRTLLSDFMISVAYQNTSVQRCLELCSPKMHVDVLYYKSRYIFRFVP